jgi:hypothetical protein
MQAAQASASPSPFASPEPSGPAAQAMHRMASGLSGSTGSRPSSALGSRARPRSAVEHAHELADGVFEKSRAPVNIGDQWRMSCVLEMLIASGCFFNASQAIRVVRSMEFSKSRVTAVMRMYGSIVDDQRAVYECLTAYEKQLFGEAMGGLKVFSSKNMTGKYLLSLAIGAHYTLASYMLQSYKIQLERGLCSWPMKARVVALRGSVVVKPLPSAARRRAAGPLLHGTLYPMSCLLAATPPTDPGRAPLNLRLPQKPPNNHENNSCPSPT